MIKIFATVFCPVFCIVSVLSFAAMAQDIDPAQFAQPPIPTLLPAANDPALAAPSTTPPASVIAAPPPVADGEIVSPTPLLVSTDTVKKKESIFFTPNQLISIMRANQGFIAPREAFDIKNQSDNPTDMGPRAIAITGIIYNGSNDWTVWINNERVTPKNIPDRIMGINVSSDRVRLRWMDIGNQRIVNVTLRTNQIYLLDTDTIISGSQQ